MVTKKYFYKIIFRITWIICALWLLTSCSKKDQPVPGSIAVVHQNVPYGSNKQQQMDVYLPAGRSMTSTPLLVLIHGGAWISGDKSDFAPYLDSIKEIFSGYAIANINYRLANLGVNLFPTQEDDVDSAMQYLLRHRKEYDISSRFVYIGFSAGGHLALLQAYKYKIPHAVAVVSFYGPVDMAYLYLHSPDTALTKYIPLLMEGTPSQNLQLYFSSSPINYVSAQSCPTLLLQGGKDPLVPPAEAFRLSDTLQTLGVVHQLVFYPNEGHGWTDANLHDSFMKTRKFLEKNVQ